ncbi:hypothetical protein [Paenibacillus pseudetheri]|uniref:Uncharacterized protein n=1 Tax=Paenibacillus pseudetheri TaxID=2897682 RepID=A0ABM9BN20_9BACL|nr:hypothetical protein [Paenibacillus pseudetheri]CAH1059498.1 hypothetical protein PAECIP111894_05707 [Paenibacillus pseudetheri]
MNKNIKLVSLVVILCVAVGIPSVLYAGTRTENKVSEELTSKIENNTEIIRGNHPRKEGLWPQYTGLNTALRGNIIFSDIITPDALFENWKGEKIETHDLSKQTAENYDSTHNHYQNLLSEVMNFKEDTNAVSIWGDSAAIANNSKAWGGFLSARSDYKTFLENETYKKYVPEGINLEEYSQENYDAQLVGLEIDVLNGGKPGIYPNKSKTGLQIVGFGNSNSMAIEVRNEDTDKNVAKRNGAWESGIYFKNSMAEYGRLIVADFDKAKIGLDFRNALFSEGAAQFRSEGVGTGVLLNGGKSGEIYGGLRWTGFQHPENWLTLRAGEGGIRIASNDNTKELIAVDNNGGIYLNGDVYINGRKLNDLVDLDTKVNDLEKQIEELKKMILNK